MLTPRSFDSFALRVPEASLKQLPLLLQAAEARHGEMHRALHLYRSAFLYEMPLDGQPAATGAVCAIVADLARRFAVHLPAWTAPANESGATGGASVRAPHTAPSPPPRWSRGRAARGSRGRGAKRKKRAREPGTFLSYSTRRT